MEKRTQIVIAVLFIPTVFVLVNFAISYSEIFTPINTVNASANNQLNSYTNSNLIPAYWLDALSWLNSYTQSNPNASMLYNIAEDNPTRTVSYNYYAIGVACASGITLVALAVSYKRERKKPKAYDASRPLSQSP